MEEAKCKLNENLEIIDHYKYKYGQDGSDHNEKTDSMIGVLDSSPLFKDPTFAQICSFFNLFSNLLGIKPVTIAKLEEMFCTLIDGDVNRELVDLHVTLMRKIYLKSARVDKWEQFLRKFCSIASGMESEFRRLQRHNYVDIPLDSKMEILKTLCDSQFDWNLKFKENIANTFRNNEMRLSPIGCDKTGQLYYLQLDCELDFCIYTEEPDDMAGVSWMLKARTDADLIELIFELSNPDFGLHSKNEMDGEGNEDKKDLQIDEEHMLDHPEQNNEEQKNSKKIMRHSSFGYQIETNSSSISHLNLDEEERSRIKMENKFSTLWDCYRKSDVLNKRKTEKENRRKEQLKSILKADSDECISTNVITKSEIHLKEDQIVEKSEQEDNEKGILEDTKIENKEIKIEDAGQKEAVHDKNTANFELNEKLLAELDAEDQRRILPRRNAKNMAIQNLKIFTSTPRKPRQSQTDSEERSTPPTRLVKSLIATAGSCTDDDSSDDEESDEDNEAENTSDGEFYLDDDERPKVRQMARSTPKKRIGSKQTRNIKSKSCRNKGIKKKLGHSKSTSTSMVYSVDRRNKRKALFGSTSNISDESSEGEGEEHAQKEIERKKATAQTFCQICNSAKRPDLLLLCDSCDEAWHTFCIRPQLWFVPDENWFCPLCEHNSLIQRLRFALYFVRDERIKYKEDNEKKETAADRLKREMDYIGISLNNIIPLAMKKDEGTSNDNEILTSSSNFSNEDKDQYNEQRMRKSKRRAIRIAISQTKEIKNKKYYGGPIVTIAEGRTRRTLNKVDYNFKSYHSQLQKAMQVINPNTKINHEEEEESTGFIGRGKDIQSIVEAEKFKQQEEIATNEESATGNERNENGPARPPIGRNKKVGGRKQKRLTDLDIDNATESDTDEWHATSADEIEEDTEPSGNEHFLSFERGISIRGKWARHKSDDDFINDDSDPDYIMSNSTRRRKRRGSKNKINRRKRRLDDDSDEDDYHSSDSDTKILGPNKKTHRFGSHTTPRKWGPKASSSSDGNEYVQQEDESDKESSDRRITESGRPLRKAAELVNKKLMEQVEDEKKEEEEDVDDEEEYASENNVTSDRKSTGEQDNGKQSGSLGVRFADRAVSALARPLRKATLPLDDEDEFQPNDDEEAQADEEEEETEHELEEEQRKSSVEQGSGSSGYSDEENEDEKEEKKEKDRKEHIIKSNQRIFLKNQSKRERQKLGKKMKRTRSLSAGIKQITGKRSKKNDKKMKDKIMKKVQPVTKTSIIETPPTISIDKRQTRQQLRRLSVDEHQKDSTGSSTTKEVAFQIFTKKEEESNTFLTQATTSISSVDTSLAQKISTTNKITIYQPAHSQQPINYLSRSSTTTPLRLSLATQHLSRPLSIPTSSATDKSTLTGPQSKIQPSINALSSFRFPTSQIPVAKSIGYTVTSPCTTIINSESTFVAVTSPTSAAIGLAHTIPQQIPASCITLPQQAGVHPSYIMQSTGGQPQIIYQTLQPAYAALTNHHQPSIVTSHHSTQSQDIRIVSGLSDQDGSLSHALAGAMNPEDL